MNRIKERLSLIARCENLDMASAITSDAIVEIRRLENELHEFKKNKDQVRFDPYVVMSISMDYISLQTYLNQKHNEGWDIVSVSESVTCGFLVVLRRTK